MYLGSESKSTDPDGDTDMNWLWSEMLQLLSHKWVSILWEKSEKYFDIVIENMIWTV